LEVLRTSQLQLVDSVLHQSPLKTQAKLQAHSLVELPQQRITRSLQAVFSVVKQRHLMLLHLKALPPLLKASKTKQSQSFSHLLAKQNLLTPNKRKLKSGRKISAKTHLR